MPILTLREVSLSYGSAPLLDGVNLSIEAGERISLVGRNGAGKSTLMRVLTGDVVPDQGEAVRADGLRVAMLTQAVPAGTRGSVFDVVAGGLGATGERIRRYHRAVQALAARPGDAAALGELERAQHDLEADDGWHLEQRVETVLSRLDLPADDDFGALSGGLKRRVLLARALVAEPDLLLLDEPTNHLDIQAIEWLETFLLGFGGTLLFITHDRAFLRRLATRIIELDRGRLTDWPGDYDTYLRRKQEALDAEERANALFDKKLAQEEAWIRQGIKARRTRNEGRVRALKALRAERARRRERAGTANLQIRDAERSGRLVIEAEGVCFGYGGEPVIRDFSTLILRGDRVGLVGPNGSGKTTLLRLLLGRVAPHSGRVRLGTNLEVAYFDQHREALDEEASVADNVGEGRDRIMIGSESRHVLSYLQDFLFEPARARQPVKALSGGERNRLLLAKLFTRPANLLVLDEPTNDLDAETLELLEERLVAFTGTVLVVSHDRAFLDNVVTSIIAFEGAGQVNEYVGGYADWLRQRPPAPEPEQSAPPSPKPAPAPRLEAGGKPKKLSYKDQRELASLPSLIETLEAEQAELTALLSDPDVYRQSPEKVSRAQARLAEIESELARCYERWEMLEGS
ncbi:ABC transporter ATP-binding protein [Thioalkalivibrio denitrificans]|uniref:ATP-binding protein Uup n=1 Tax=Thioalkalivibrio denitrificans TaxID=108003 RepID=A0A1V3NDJ3_9GAMM|nr:ATP-binding cassette domain-containing protein [Thioalkalivibrio denitrificans]OOG22948.1 ABC transporter ATP-binding protein [Thioalkalivibrio denitrificans]